MRILLTGGHGLIGRHVAAALAGRADVSAPTRAEADLMRPDDRARIVAGADLLIHLAWITEHGRFWHAPENADWQAASTDLFARFYAAGGRRAVGLGTCAEYDWTRGTDRYAEDAPLAPHTAYGAAKVRTAEALATLAARHGASWAWGRIFFLFGRGEPPGRLIPLMTRAVREGTPLGIGPGDTLRDFWDVRNLGAAIAALALSDLDGPVNLASGTATSFAALATLIERLAGTSGLIRPGSRPLGPGEPRLLVADTQRLDTRLGFVAPVALDRGLADCLAA